MIREPRTLPKPETPVIGTNNRMTRDWYDYFREWDTAMRSVVAMTNPVAFANLPTGTEGQIAYVSNGRKAGQGVGAGTGVLAFHDGSTWIAVDTGTAVAA